MGVETFFEKDEVAENGGVDFGIGDIGTSAHLYWRLKKISCRTCLLSYCIFDDKKMRLKLTVQIQLALYQCNPFLKISVSVSDEK